MNNQTIPQTDSIRELAQFWDTHDLTDIEDQLEEVSDTVFERPVTTVVVSLRFGEIEALKRIAESKGVRYDALIREWVIEKLHTS